MTHEKRIYKEVEYMVGKSKNNKGYSWFSRELTEFLKQHKTNKFRGSGFSFIERDVEENAKADIRTYINFKNHEYKDYIEKDTYLEYNEPCPDCGSSEYYDYLSDVCGKCGRYNGYI